MQQRIGKEEKKKISKSEAKGKKGAKLGKIKNILCL